jgi:hypothetical protein
MCEKILHFRNNELLNEAVKIPDIAKIFASAHEILAKTEPTVVAPIETVDTIFAPIKTVVETVAPIGTVDTIFAPIKTVVETVSPIGTVDTVVSPIDTVFNQPENTVWNLWGWWI